MSLNLTGLLAAAESHAMSLGVFERVNRHEPKNAPGPGLVAAIWVQDVGPVSSGLAQTSARVELTVRVYLNMMSEPQDDIDPRIVNAVDVLIAAYSIDFDLGGLVRNIDLLGAHGASLRARAGYINQDKVMMRVMDITLPLIVNDAWDQVA